MKVEIDWKSRRYNQTRSRDMLLYSANLSYSLRNNVFEFNAAVYNFETNILLLCSGMPLIQPL